MTISDVAKMADVSVSAVSRYMNGGYVSEEKKERIKKAIQETGYVPSAHAQTMRTKRTKVVGVVIPKINSESISRVVAGISEELSETGYELLLGNTGNNQEQELRYLKIFDQNRVDGIIFIGTMMNKEHEKLLKSLQVPVVLLGQQESYISCVYHDDYHAAREMAAILAAGKHKKIGFLGVPARDKAVGKERYRGFCDALSEAGLPVEDKRVLQGEFTLESGYENARTLMELAPDTDALFCVTDTIAIGAMKYLREIGKRIPEDVSIAGIGDTRMSEMMNPPLTTAHYYYQTSGREGAKILLEKLKNPDLPDKKMMLGYEIVQRGSILL